MNCGKRLRGALLRLLSICLVTCMPALAFAHGSSDASTNPPIQWNLTRGVTPISHDLYDLHMVIFWICVGIGTLVFGVLIYTLIMHRKSRGVKPATFHENTKLEIIWMLIPLLILVIMAIPSTLVLMRMSDDAHSEVTIKVTGYQWKWRYAYLNHGISYFSNLSTPIDQRENLEPKGPHYLLEVDKPLVVPIHQKIRFLVTSNDVIHSWWVPELGVKRDGIPGFIYEAWARIDKPGTYRGQCAELCGVGHGYMPIVVEAKTPADYAKWLASQGAKNIPKAAKTTGQQPGKAQGFSQATAMAQGRKVYGQQCAVCHRATGLGMPPAFPAIAGSRVATGPEKAHIDLVLHGKKGTAMQAFGDQLSDADIAAVITYQRNSWGNNDRKRHGKQAGGLVTPNAIAKARQSGA